MNDDSVLPSHLEEHRELAPRNRYASRVVANILDQWFEPRTMLDLGCGNGVWLRGFAAGGKREVLGVEFERFEPDELEVAQDWILHGDMGKKIDLHRRFDLVLCLEVAEHVDPDAADTVVDNCVRHSDIVLFSAAVPGQQGLHHVNEQLPEYWAERFARRGYVVLDLIRPLIWDDPQIPVWYRQNMLLYVREGAPVLDRLQAELPRSVAALPLNRVHPELMFWFSQDATATHAAHDAVQRSLRVETARAKTAEAALKEVRAELVVTKLAVERLRAERDVIRRERDVIVGSSMWRAMAPLRSAGQKLPAPIRQLARRLARRTGRRLLRPATWLPSRVAQGVAAVAADPRAAGGPVSGLKIVFISGEPETPGHHYRVLRAAAAAAAAGAVVRWFTIAEAGGHLAETGGAAVLVVWRAPWSTNLAEILRVARQSGARIVYDVDDLMFLPELARVEVIDGIRSQNFDADEVAVLFENTRKALLAADICTCTTTEIALRIRAYQKPAFIVPNGFDESMHRRSRLAMRRWRAQGDKELVRLGYAGGSRTHQKDFAVLADAVARVLRERPNCRLVLFRTADVPLVDIGEYPMLAALEHQIEWRLMRKLDELPDELARFDINLAPLEAGNPFCEAKSELKYFEAALADVCTIASPTGPFRRSMREGETGFLAIDAEDWHDRLIELVDDPLKRRAIGHAAYLDVIWPYGPQRRQESLAALLLQLQGGAPAARALELEVLRQSARKGGAPEVPSAATVFHHDALGEADVTVVIPLHNYAHHIFEALDSVRRQSLEAIDLVVVNDASTDDSLNVATEWARQNASRFNRLLVLSNHANVGLALTRNVGIDAAETPTVFLLDADNRLLPGCTAACLEAIRASGAAFAYPQIQCFGDSDEVIGTPPFEPMRLAGGNYIDAMAMVAKWSWAAVGGYRHVRHGWEDYDFWCSLVEHGFWGSAVPKILAEYRVHGSSMLRTTTDLADHKRELIQELERRHPWLAIPSGE